jgi:glucose/arabinose dehydrogenase
MKLRRIFLVAAFLIFAATPSHSQLQLQVAFPNLAFTRPVDLQHPGDGTDRIFVVEQAGVIKVFENSPSIATAKIFLDIKDRVNDLGNEEGLLGLAFHPDYKSNGYFYVNYTATSPRRTVIARYRVSATDPNQAVADGELVILTFNQPYENHNGGQLAFGPDGYLYIATGDGGSANDPQGNGQSLQTLLGKILRLDVNNPSGGRNYGIPPDNPFAGTGNREEIYAYGLRNPWRFSFDPPTSRLWAADVGQNRFEEINLITRGGNYGWKIMEGNSCFSPSTGCNMTGLIKPVWDYGRSLGQSVTGGYVYRGKANPELVGAYIYADYISNRMWALRYDGVNPPSNTDLPLAAGNVSSFGIDKNNELYICGHQSGRIYRFKPTATQVDDGNARPVSNQLQQNYPNPFGSAPSLAAGDPLTIIAYSVTQTAPVEISLYNLQGQLVRTLVRQSQTPGKHVTTWDGRDDNGQIMPSGTYLYRLQIGGNFVETRRLMWIK